MQHARPRPAKSAGDDSASAVSGQVPAGRTVLLAAAAALVVLTGYASDSVPEYFGGGRAQEQLLAQSWELVAAAANPNCTRRPCVYILPLPTSLNVAMVASCSGLTDFGDARQDACASVQNGGLGPRLPFPMKPTDAWFETRFANSGSLEARPCIVKHTFLS